MKTFRTLSDSEITVLFFSNRQKTKNDQKRHPNPRLVTNDLLDVAGLFLFEQTDHIDFFVCLVHPIKYDFHIMS